MKIRLKSEKEIKILREGGKILAEALHMASEKARQAERSAVSTLDLDAVARDVIQGHGGTPSFLGYADGGLSPFPAALCTSINNEVVHGIPSKDKILKTGNILKLDLGVKYKGLYTDAALTLPIGKVDPKALDLIETTSSCLRIGLEHIYPGSFLGNYGNAVDKHIKMRGFHTIRKLVGHGVGYAVHESPQVPNYGKVGQGLKLEKGMVLALEPMVNMSDEEIDVASYGEGWVFVTNDGGLSAHFEHTVAVTDNGCEVLTEL